jgi:hypothetical protein
VKDVPSGEISGEFALPAAQLASDLAHVAWAQSNEETRYYLKGTALQFAEGSMFLAATDGHNLAYVKREAPEIEGEPCDMIIPRKATALIGRMLKGRDEAVALEVSERRMMLRAECLTLIAKPIDGTFPDWRKVLPADDCEMQLIGLPEMEPRIPLSAVEMCRKALGSSPVMEMTDDRLRLTIPAAPEFCAIAMLARDGKLPAGYAYESAGTDKALAYLTELASIAGLPQLSHECQPGTERAFTIIDAHLHIESGMVIGATFGQQTQHAGVDHEWADEPDYETFTMREVRREVWRGDEWQDGAYSIAMPRERAGMAAAVTMGTPGVDERAVATKNDAIILDAAAVARLAGDPADWERVEIPALTFYHGKPLEPGWALPPPMTTIRAKERGGKNKLRKMTDREVMDAYNEDPAAVMTALRVRPSSEANIAVKVIEELAQALSGWHEHEAEAKAEPSAAIIPFPSERRAAEIAAATEIEAGLPTDAEGSETPVEEARGKTAVLEPATPQSASEAAPAAPEVATDPSGEAIAAMFEEMRRRIEALEAAANGCRTQPEEENPAPPSAETGGAKSREARLRLVRRCLRMRQQLRGEYELIDCYVAEKRDLGERAHLAEDSIAAWQDNAKRAEQRAEDAEFKAADLERRLEEVSGKLAAETARADSADARWNIVLDEKQARIVELENEKIARLSGGRIKLATPLRANARPAVPLWRQQ